MDTEMFTMSWIDYTVFVIMLLLSALIGLYQGFKKKKKQGDTVEEYLFAGRNSPAIPVVMSNMASNISSIGLVLMPLETYYFGTQLIYVCVAELFAAFMLYFYFVPVFYHLKYTSIFEYLEKRFNRPTRLLGSAIYVLTQIFYALVIMYAACMSITKAFPIPFYALTTIICIICIIYTVTGGLRGVVWADFLQATFMYVSLILIIILATYQVGGVSKTIEIAEKGGRFNVLNFDPNPFSRYSAWSISLSTMLFALYNSCTNPGIIQRYLSLPTYSKARTVVIGSGLANIAMGILEITLGVLVYTVYHDCDPLMSKAISNPDQLIPHYIMNMDHKIPGLTGLFLAGIISAALSTLSTMMNSLSGILFDDFVKPNLTIEWNDRRINIWLKTIVVTLGLIVTIGLFQINAAAGGYQLFRTLTSLTGGLIVFVFCFGLFYRRANVKNTLIGAIAGVIVSAWLGIGIQTAVGSGKIQYVTKIVSIAGCPENITAILNTNVTTSGTLDYSTPVIFAEDVPYMYRISFSLLMFIGTLVSVIVGLVASIFTSNRQDLDENLLVKQIRRKPVINNEDCLYIKCNQDEKL
ncbi:hypothetical protein O3M35_007872 [Rhynocoris fuscipes]|uniref:Sodium-coupled monocarboxylate transporter 1 n=1 Tax=Rhynocoris fuscipes TaxID=488301 RepID=A0AAW1DCB3_9HEMI